MATVTQTWQEKKTQLYRVKSWHQFETLLPADFEMMIKYEELNSTLHICFELPRLCSFHSTGLIKNVSKKSLINRSYSSLSKEAVFANFCCYPKPSLSQKAIQKTVLHAIVMWVYF